MGCLKKCVTTENNLNINKLPFILIVKSTLIKDLIELAYFLLGTALAIELRMNRIEGLLIVGAFNFSLLAVVPHFFASAFIPGLLIFTDAKAIESITGSLVLITTQIVQLFTYFGKEATSRNTTKVSSMIFAILTYAFHFLGAC